MSIELMLNAGELELVAFANYWNTHAGEKLASGQTVVPLSGPMFSYYILWVVAAAKRPWACHHYLGFPYRETLNVDRVNLLKL